LSKIRQFDPFKKAAEVVPQTPSVVLFDPRYPHNVGAAVRACSCFGVQQVWLQGRRVADQVLATSRLPREERMKGFSDVTLVLEEKPLSAFPGAVPVAVELLPGAENLLGFEHPANAIYLFGPEDGSVPHKVLGQCHRRVFLPTKHCTNLGAAVYLVLYDRLMKRYLAGEEQILPIQDVLCESRGWGCDDNPIFD
jgi:tRNA(Leu) C34 or U34 (ribose-2'-O)-methylase TrmL